MSAPGIWQYAFGRGVRVTVYRVGDARRRWPDAGSYVADLHVVQEGTARLALLGTGGDPADALDDLSYRLARTDVQVRIGWGLTLRGEVADA